MKLGTLDWGIGGLGVHQRLLALGVADDALYLSDAGFTPYGKLEEDALAARVAGCLERLASAGCTHVVVGCNAASTVLSHPRVRHAAATLQDVLGVIAPTLDAVLAAPPAEVLVLGGARTVASNLYARPLEAAGVRVRQRVAQPLSALIEAGVLEGPALDACLDAICGPVSDARVVILACTHYPAVADAIARRFPHLERCVDPSVETARVAHARWGMAHAPTRATTAWTTGDPAASGRAALAAFGVEARFERVP